MNSIRGVLNKIENPVYISRLGDESKVNLGVGVSPYGDNKEGYAAINNGVVGVKWNSDGEEYTTIVGPKDKSIGIRGSTIWAYPTPDMSFMIIVYKRGYGPKKPNNAVVFDNKGKAIKELICPNPDRLFGFSNISWNDNKNQVIMHCDQKKQYWMEDRALLIPSFEFTDEVLMTWRL